MIIVRISAGLGNQMFQYAAGLTLAEAHRTVLKLDVSWYRRYPGWEAHNRYALSCFNITEQFATQDEIDRMRDAQTNRLTRLKVAVADRLHFHGYAQRHTPDPIGKSCSATDSMPNFWSSPTASTFKVYTNLKNISPPFPLCSGLISPFAIPPILKFSPWLNASSPVSQSRFIFGAETWSPIHNFTPRWA